MELTFKRGTSTELENLDITQNMVYFTTDNNSIYMDDNDNRYKIFGLNDDDVSATLSDIGINKYYNKTLSYDLLHKNEVAYSYDTDNKIAIGEGYYSDVIGNDIQDVLYNQYPSITSSISYLQTIARSSLHTIWTNSDPDHTWASSHDGVYFINFSDTISIPMSEKYLGYIVLIQSCLQDNNSIYPMLIFDLPSSPYYYRKQVCECDYVEDGIFFKETIKNTIKIYFDTSTPNQMLIEKSVYAPDVEDVSIRRDIMHHENFVPIAVYGWRI